MSLEAYIYSNIGGREENQDCADFDIARDTGFFVIADGLGGLQGGRLASQAAVKFMFNSWEELLSQNKLDETDFRQWLPDLLMKANELILYIQQQKLGKMKTTVAALVVRPDKIYYSTLGDSRLYCISKGMIVQLSEDHSVSYNKFLGGQISRAQINFDPDRSSLLRVLGDSERCIPDTGVLPLPEAPSAFLLCTDGFWENIYEEEILFDCLKSQTPQQWTEYMLLRIMPRRKPDGDNLSALSIFAD